MLRESIEKKSGKPGIWDGEIVEFGETFAGVYQAFQMESCFALGSDHMSQRI